MRRVSFFLRTAAPFSAFFLAVQFSISPKFSASRLPRYRPPQSASRFNTWIRLKSGSDRKLQYSSFFAERRGPEVAERVAKRAYVNRTESKIAERSSQCTARIEGRKETCRLGLHDASIMLFLNRILGLTLCHIDTPCRNMYVNRLEFIRSEEDAEWDATFFAFKR